MRTSYDTKEPETFYSNGGGEGVRGGGGGCVGNSRLPHFVIPDPTSSFLDFRPFILFFFRLQNIDHCCVISPISNTINGLILEVRESTVGYLYVVQGSKPPAPTPCIPGSLFFALIFYA